VKILRLTLESNHFRYGLVKNKQDAQAREY